MEGGKIGDNEAEEEKREGSVDDIFGNNRVKSTLGQKVWTDVEKEEEGTRQEEDNR